MSASAHGAGGLGATAAGINKRKSDDISSPVGDDGPQKQQRSKRNRVSIELSLCLSLSHFPILIRSLRDGLLIG